MTLEGLIVKMVLGIPAGAGALYCISQIQEPSLRAGLGIPAAGLIGYTISRAIIYEVAENKKEKKAEE